jgi:hypothetical protein
MISSEGAGPLGISYREVGNESYGRQERDKGSLPQQLRMDLRVRARVELLPFNEAGAAINIGGVWKGRKTVFSVQY